jgi:hypothetical protein
MTCVISAYFSDMTGFLRYDERHRRIFVTRGYLLQMARGWMRPFAITLAICATLLFMSAR